MLTIEEEIREKSKKVGDFVSKVEPRAPHILEHIFLKYISKADIELCAQVCLNWRLYIKNGGLDKKIKADGSIWLGTNRKLLAQKAFSLPKNHNIQDFVYDAKRDVGLVFHTSRSIRKTPHYYATQIQNPMSPNKKSIPTLTTTSWVAPNQLIDEDLETLHQRKANPAEDKLEAYHCNNVLFLKDSIAFVADTKRTLFFNRDGTNSQYLNFGSDVRNIKIARLRNHVNGMVMYGLRNTYDESGKITQIFLMSEAIRDVHSHVPTPEVFEVICKQPLLCPGQNFGPAVNGVGLQTFAQNVIVSQGLGHVRTFKVPKDNVGHVTFNTLNLKIQRKTLKGVCKIYPEKEEISMYNLKFLELNERYLVAVGTAYKNEHVWVIKCFDTHLQGEEVFRRVYYPRNSKQSIGNVSTVGPFLYWTTSSKAGSNEYHLVHCWCSTKNRHLSSVRVGSYYAKNRLQFIMQPFMAISPTQTIVPMKELATDYSRTRRFKLFIISTTDGTKLQEKKQIHINLGNYTSGSDVRFFVDSTGLDIFIAEFKSSYSLRRDHPGSPIIAISLKPNPYKYRTLKKNTIKVESVTIE